MNNIDDYVNLANDRDYNKTSKGLEENLLDIEGDDDSYDHSKSFHENLMDAFAPDDPIATVFLKNGEELKMRLSWTEEFIERNEDLIGHGKFNPRGPRRKPLD